MPRIPESEIERIKKETDLSALVRSRGIELKQHGSKDLIGRCPFHDDHDPSFVVTPSKGLFHCLGCGAAGNAIQFVERFDSISFRHAFELLAEGGNAAFKPASACRAKKPNACRLDCPLDPEASDTELMNQVVDYYHERLLQTPVALEYLKKRGLHDETALRAFRLGFADRSLGLRLPSKKRVDGKLIRNRLQKLGLWRQSGHEHLNGSIVVPIFDPSGSITELYGRKVRDDLRKGTPNHLYLPGPHKGIWNAEVLNSSEIILCEAPLDALTLWVNGMRNTTFIYGTQGFTDELFDALIEHKIKTVRLAYDNDESGNKAAERDAKRLAAVGIEVYRVKFPHGMDANEYATKVRPASQSLATAIQSAEWLGGASRAPSSLVAIAAKEKIHPPEDPVDPVNLVKNSPGSPVFSVPPCESLSLIRVDPCSSAVQTPSLLRQGDYHVLELGPRHYRVGGMEKNNSLEVLKIALRLRHGEDFYLDAVDLTRDTDRRRFIERASEETRLEKELIKRDLGKLLLALEETQQERLTATLSTDKHPPSTELTSAEREEALNVLKSPDLIERITSAFDECGLVGESVNRLAAYLACTSRKLSRPLAVIIQSTSAAGKSTLMDAVLSMFPNEEQVKYSAMTGQSLYYLGETNLKHRILAIVEEEGAEKASYALKLLQSEGELTIASTGKDAKTGRMETQEYHVEGPVMIFLTTTAIDIDEELQNRCLTLSVDESREQTERIHTLQRQARTLEGLRLKKKKKRLLTLMQNVQRLLEPIEVVNPWADQLTFTTERTRTRRDHEKYLTLIESITLLHQRQRPRETDDEGGSFIRVTLEDLELANQLAPELLARSLDELPPQTRRVLETVKQIVRERMDSEKIEQPLATFSRREVRDRLGWSVTQIREHLERLREFEYIAARTGRAGTAFQYELFSDCKEPRRFEHIGLLDVKNLQIRSQPVGKKDHLSGGCRPPARQVQPIKKQRVKPNLSGCRVRTSGSPVLVES